MKSGIIKINEHIFDVIIPTCSLEYQKGLMGVEWPPNCMVFPYRTPMVRKFWMKDTPSPLDIIFCKKGKIIDICKGVPFSTESVGPNEPSDMVIELPFGHAIKFKIKLGDKVELLKDSSISRSDKLLKIAQKIKKQH